MARGGRQFRFLRFRRARPTERSPPFRTGAQRPLAKDVDDFAFKNTPIDEALVPTRWRQLPCPAAQRRPGTSKTIWPPQSREAATALDRAVASSPPSISPISSRLGARCPDGLPFERLHLLNLRQEVPEQVLDSVPQRGGRGGAAGAGAFHFEVDDAVAKTLEDDVAAVARHGGADAGLDQLLDRLDRLGVLGVKELARRRDVGAARLDQRRARQEEFGHHPEHCGARS